MASAMTGGEKKCLIYLSLRLFEPPPSSEGGLVRSNIQQRDKPEFILHFSQGKLVSVRKL